MVSTKYYEFSVEKPLNREPPVDELVRNYLTEVDGYDRNHGPIPHIDPDAHTVHVDGLVRSPLTLSISDLRARFPQHTVVAALQCAGNRRHTMRTKLREVQGIDWGDGAVMNCLWSGPRLRDVLIATGVELDADTGSYDGKHAAFACHQTQVQQDEWYGASVPLERAMSVDAEAIVALDMNSSPLTPYHGGPVRIILPGIAGARCVKWLDRITVQARDSPNFYQHFDYKVLPPHVTSSEEAEPVWPAVPPLLEMPANSVVATPRCGATAVADADGCVGAKGYALPSGDGGPVVKVEVSGDGGVTWQMAKILEPPKKLVDVGLSLKWAWVLWQARVKVAEGTGRKILSRATDISGNTQSAEPVWNLRGVAYDGYGEADDLTVVKEIQPAQAVL
ncbi:sulfite oxidase [Lineolata rhizophorae]|uniref:Sulfite oxidase n=1 Tax=Lineolata rhizophorae TaxID=578093 RepID=A0A6A6NV18_9PEZI|nr:sulfite oxidase [Lineolata rhizophorae]